MTLSHRVVVGVGFWTRAESRIVFSPPVPLLAALTLAVLAEPHAGPDAAFRPALRRGAHGVSRLNSAHRHAAAGPATGARTRRRTSTHFSLSGQARIVAHSRALSAARASEERGDLLDSGKYVQADGDEGFAFERTVSRLREMGFAPPRERR